MEINEYNQPLAVNDEVKARDISTIHKLSSHPGRPKGTTDLHSKHPSSIAKRLKLAGVDWIVSFGKAIQRNDKQLLTIWLRLLPYLVVTAGHRRPKKLKGRASKAALEALKDLEQA
jgi:hypothetical protein